MPKFRKKPVVIEAHQYIGNILPMGDFFDGKVMSEFTDSRGPYIMIQTLEGNMIGEVGDFIIKGVNGEFYPCKPDIFEKTYEAVDRPHKPVS